MKNLHILAPIFVFVLFGCEVPIDSADSSAASDANTAENDAQTLDATSADAVVPVCGNGIVEGDEACDDGNRSNNDQCTSSCELARCGDGLVQIGEEVCDDGNTDNTDDCLNTCMAASCGDGFLQTDIELCDDGNSNDNDQCTSSCERARCGDGLLQVGVEACDDGNDDETDDCLANCQAASCGDGFIQASAETCDDANLNDADRCTNACQLNQPCAGVSTSCGARDDWQPGLTEHEMETTDACAFALIAPTEAEWQEGISLADQLSAEMLDVMPISGVLSDLNRQGENGVTNQTATRMRNHDFSGWTWNSGDMGVSYWMPQGITGSSDASANGFVSNRRLMMVSWYHATDERPTKGVRVSLADLTDFNDIHYRHLLLVVPFLSAIGPNYTEAYYDHNDDRDALHAGGIVWYGDYLYVADTRVGIRVFDLSKVMRVSHTDQNGRIGLVNGRSDAHGYRYVVPQIARYRLSDDACPLSFSSLSLDRSTNPPTLLSAEYRSSDIQSRFVHWPLDGQTGKLMDIEGRIDGRDAKMGAQTRVQGALSYDGNYYISSSSQYLRFGRLYRTRPGQESSRSAWVYGCEDLYYERRSNLIWTAAEFADFRDVIGIPLPLP